LAGQRNPLVISATPRWPLDQLDSINSLGY